VSVPPEHFARIAGRVNVPLLATKLVVIIGVGTVGSQIARELANSGVRRLLLIDDDRLEEPNLIRHALPREYLGMNKAEAMTLYLAAQVPTLRPTALPRKVDGAMSDDELDQLLNDADLIIAATDEREAQRQIARRALALDIPAIFPALYGDNGGEVFVQRSPRNPCFFCWDGYRTADERLRGIEALNADTLAVLQIAVQLSLGVLDLRSEYARPMAPARNDPRPRQLFIQRRFAALEMSPQRRRPDCPVCAVGPALLRRQAAEAWDTAERERAQATLQTLPPLHRPVTPPAPHRPLRHFNFGDWLSGCIGYSIFMLIPDIWLSVWVHAVWIHVVDGVKTEPSGFPFMFYLIMSATLGVIASTIVSLWEL
jgi:molybdopterin/thiamine biosynthesis adenylyltransferase